MTRPTVGAVALTIQQPWLWAILHAGKTVENRRWETPYRGWLALHAARRIDDHGIRLLRSEHPDMPATLPLGAILGVARVIDCHHANFCGLACSSWAAEGQYHWQLTDIQPLDKPIEAKGALGLWRLTLPIGMAIQRYMTPGGPK